MAEPGASVTLHTATPDDALAIAGLSGQLGYPADRDAIDERLQRLLPDAEHRVCVARVEGTVVGWAHVMVAHRVESAPFAELAGLVVDAERRREGIGRLLVEDAAAWAANMQLTELRVRTNELRSEPHRFYAALGFAPSKVQRVARRAVGNRTT